MGESGVGSRKVTIQSGNTTFKKTFEENQLPEKCQSKLSDLVNK